MFRNWLVVFIITTLALIVPVSVLAQNNFRSGDVASLPAGEQINSDYFSAGENVSLDGVVNGDAYLAGGQVTLNGQVNGDLLVAGGTLNLNGTVTGNIRSAGGNINIGGVVGRNITAAGGSINIAPTALLGGSVTAAGGNLNISAPVAKGITLAGGQASIGEKVGGDINGAVGQLTLNPLAKVAGNVTYWSENKASISPQASISGTISQRIPPKTTRPEVSTQAANGFFSFFRILSFLTALVFGLLILKLLPELANKVSAQVSQNWLANLGVGFLALAITPIVVILLLITVVGIPAIFVWLFFIIFDLWLSKIFVAMAVGVAVAKYFKQTWGKYSTYIVGLIIYYLICLIPVIGWIFGFLTMLIGLGAIIWTKRQNFLELRQKKII